MRFLLAAALAALVVGCAPADEFPDEMTMAPDGGVFAAPRAVVEPPPVHILEDKRLNEVASFLNDQILFLTPGLETYFLGGSGGGQIYFTWQYFLPGLTAQPMPVAGAAHAASRATTDLQSVAQGQYGCFAHACTVTFTQPMAASSVFHTDDSFPRNWWPAGVTKPQVRPPTPQVRKQYRYRCPNSTFSASLGEGPWIDLGTAPDLVVVNDWTQDALPGVFADPNRWRDVATYCNVNTSAFSLKQIITCKCNMQPTQVEFCQYWPSGGTCSMDPETAAYCHMKCGK